MSLPAHIPHDHYDAMYALAERMGQTEFQGRLQLETKLREFHGHDQKKGFWRLEKRVDVYRWVRFCLKCAGLWNRAERNYLNIRVERNEVMIEGLPQAFDGYTILQMTDLHADLHADFPAAVTRAIEPLQYDLLVVTGDFRTCTYGDHTGATQMTVCLLYTSPSPRD